MCRLLTSLGDRPSIRKPNPGGGNPSCCEESGQPLQLTRWKHNQVSNSGWPGKRKLLGEVAGSSELEPPLPESPLFWFWR
jgi:hypothetical protein